MSDADPPANRRRVRRRTTPVAVLGFIAALAALGIWLLPARTLHPPADLGLSLLDGRTVTLATLRAHRPMLVAFWATTCEPCVEEVPVLVQLYRELKPRGVAFLAVTMPYDPPLRVQRFVQRDRLPYPVALDVTGQVERAFGGVDFIPTAFLLDADGNVLARRTGRLDPARVRHALEPEIARASPGS